MTVCDFSMSVSNVALAILFFWSLLHVFNRLLRHRNRLIVLPWNLSHGKLRSRINVSLRHVHLHIQTTICNSLHDRFTALLASKKYKKYKTVLSWFYEFGCLASIVGMVGACAMLSWSCWTLAWNMIKVANQKTSTLHSHTKRSTIHSTSRPQGWSTIQPIVSFLQVKAPLPMNQIPGVTVPFSDLPIIICAVFTSQLVHELGHAIAAAM